ncbi:threonylcarbamoyl-AMP synthase [bacterium]|nr:threonylcarbamoyl-AMP synthase [bacterium]
MPRAIVYKLHPDHPERFKIAKIADALRDGALMLFPTDSVYAVGCDPRHHKALERLRALKGVDNKKPLTLICPSLSVVSVYANIDDAAYKMMRTLTPGPFTFLLRATKEVPKLVLNPKRREAGVRVPEHPICQDLLEQLGSVIVSSSASIPGGRAPENKEQLFRELGGLVDVILDDGSYNTKITTVLDLTGDQFEILREGMGMDRLAPFVA